MKTVQETILSFPGLAEFPPAYLDNLLAARSLSGADAAGDIEARAINLAIADALVMAVNLPDFTENKLAIKYPRNYFISTARQIYALNGEPEKANSLVRGKVPRGKVSNLW